MANITAQMVKELREMTGAGMMDCKSALNETNGDIEAAVDLLRKKGLSKAAKKAGRVAAEGLVGIWSDGVKAAVVEVNSETDFVARNEDFIAFAYEVAMHIAATDPRHVSSDEIPEEDLAAERRVFEEKAREDGKPDNVVERIVDGQVAKWAKEICLMDQEHINTGKHDSKTIEQLREEISAKVGENVRIARFSVFRIGE